jgi:hypothetical protein
MNRRNFFKTIVAGAAGILCSDGRSASDIDASTSCCSYNSTEMPSTGTEPVKMQSLSPKEWLSAVSSSTSPDFVSRQYEWTTLPDGTTYYATFERVCKDGTVTCTNEGRNFFKLQGE